MKQSTFYSVCQFFRESIQLLIIILLIVITGYSDSDAASGNAVSNSYWASSSTWSFNGSNRVPTCSDTLTISSSKTVTVNSQTSYACSSPIIVYVYGTLQFTNGNKLDLPCGSVVFIMAGGTVKKSTAGGGSSTLISICGNVEWKAGDGPLYGVDTLGRVSPLPIDLISFGAKQNSSGVQLIWTTATEINNSYFTLERSSNGTTYSEIGSVRGAGNSTFSLNYSYTDFSPLSGVSYYRLKQTDFDGKNETFKPIAINFKKSNQNSIDVEVLKNPFSDNIKLSITTQLKGESEIVIYNLSGNVVYNSNQFLSENNEINIDGLSELTSGIYFLRIKIGDKISEMVRLVKM